jgi:hypothetical protein
MGKFKNIILMGEIKLLLLLAYIVSLIWVSIVIHNLLSLIVVHFLFVFLFGAFYFWGELAAFLIAPFTAFYVTFEDWRVRKYLQGFKRNIPAETVIILGNYDWSKLWAWIRLNCSKREIQSLVELLKAKKQNFSFYINSNFEDVERVMKDKTVNEVYFFGHGDSHSFQLNTDEVLYYCEFNDPLKYGKKFIHQVHCGTSYGKSLVEYLVPELNKAKCFLFRKPIDSNDIVKEFRRRKMEHTG